MMMMNTIDGNTLITKSLSSNNKESFLEFDLAEEFPAHLTIQYCHKTGKFVYLFERNIPDHRISTKEWMNRINSLYSRVIAMANNDLRRGHLYRDFVFEPIYKNNRETGLKSYNLKYEIIKRPAEKKANLVITDDNIIYYDDTNKRYITKKMDAISDENKAVIKNLIEYMQSNAGNDIYIQNLMKGNFTSMGDPEM